MIRAADFDGRALTFRFCKVCLCRFEKPKSDDFGCADSLDSDKRETCMGGALLITVTGGIIGTGILFHIGRPFSAATVAVAAYFAVRWLWVNYV